MQRQRRAAWLCEPIYLLLFFSCLRLMHGRVCVCVFGDCRLSHLAETSEEGFPHGIVGYVELKAEDAADVLDAHCKVPPRHRTTPHIAGTLRRNAQ